MASNCMGLHCLFNPQMGCTVLAADLWRPDDLIGRISLPLTSLDLTPGAVNDLWLPVPRDSGKKAYKEGGGSGMDDLPTRVHALRVVEDSSGSETAAAMVAPREDTAAGFVSRRPQQEPTPVAAEPAAPPQHARGPRQGAPGLQHNSPGGGTAMEQLRHLASNPLDALRTKRCYLHITATYLPLTELEIAAVAKAAGRQQQPGGGMATMSRGPSSAALTSGRLNDLLHRWG